MDVITKDPSFKDQICEMSVDQILYFPIKHKRSLQAMISGPIKRDWPERMFVTRTAEAVSALPNRTEKVLWVRRIL